MAPRSAWSMATREAAPPPPQQHPLERLAGEQMLVLPVQYLTFADSLGWSQQAPSSRAYLHTVDDEIAFALTQRGLKRHWTISTAFFEHINQTSNIRWLSHFVNILGSTPSSLQRGEIALGRSTILS